MTFSTKRYLSRINYQGNIAPTLANLQALQAHHLYSVPFENWDIHDKVAINLDINKMFSKVVLNQRGGFCYELNALFCQLLIELGFQAKMVSAQVYSADNDEFGKPFDHMAIIVSFDNVNYLVDVGFGEFASKPLQIDLITPQQDKRGVFQIYKRDNEYFVNKQIDNEFVAEYKFDDTSRELSEFREMCHYHQTSPKSHFTQKRLMSLAHESGRNTVSGNVFIVKNQGKSNESELTDKQATDLDYVKDLIS